jgi:predicted nucleic acid-binding protein
MLVLVDTSVWIKFFRNEELFSSELRRLLLLDAVSGHELIYGELLIGDRGGRSRFLADYERMHQAAMIPHVEVVAFVRRRELHGRGVGWIDIQLLASAVVERTRLWTADPQLAAMAGDLGVAHEVGRARR